MSTLRARLVALVVDVDGAARLEERRVIDDGAELARDGLPDLARCSCSFLCD